ncbi:uncharacterized protein K02A2.6-like, partial [Notechis scutatus]|uniref:Gypsy retrotransposon integrase-like protein 1 n=1 Tax=Notechis scutatus TaxID=8663 RepID=A0A6J1W003_9SAUR
MDEAMRDRIVLGLRDTTLQSKLLNRPNITVNEAMAKATAAEAAKKSAATMQQMNTTNRETQNSPNQSREKKAEGTQKHATATTHHEDIASSSDTEDEDEEIHRLQSERNRREKRGRKPEFQCAGCGGDHRCSEHTEVLPLTIVDRDRPSLFGLEWFSPLGIEVTGINSVSETDWEESLMKEFQDVFNGTLGKYRGTPISFSLNPNIAPIRLKARRVPFALKPKIDEQLNKLIAQGVLEPIEHARWETPIVTPVKPDGSVRICGDYKATLNHALQQSAYPVPVVQHLLHSLGGGKTAEAQTIVTHRGAFKCNRLQFGVSVAPGVFQSLMECLLQGLKGVVPYFDDVLVSAGNKKQLKDRLSDHKPLLGILVGNRATPNILSPRMTRWSEFLAAYNYKLVHRSGKAIPYADALSRSTLPDRDDDPAPTTSTLQIETLPNLPITASDIAKETAKDALMARILNWVGRGWLENDKNEIFKPFRTRQTELSVEKGCILWGDRVVPKKLQEEVLGMLHEGYPGMVKMKSLARSYVWWPGMDRDIETWVTTCNKCQKSRPTPPLAPVLDWETPRGAWSRIHIDFAGPTKGYTFLIVVDAYSNWLEVSVMNSTTTEAVTKQLRKLFAMHGLPDLLVSDNGPQFTALAFEQFLAEQGIRHALTVPVHPASNGKAERMVRYTKEALEKIDTGDIQDKINTMLTIQHITPSTSMNKSPAELLMGRKLRTYLDRLHPTYNPEKPPDSS